MPPRTEQSPSLPLCGTARGGFARVSARQAATSPSADDGGRNWRWLPLDGLTRDRVTPGKGGVFGVAVDPVADDVYV